MKMFLNQNNFYKFIYLILFISPQFMVCYAENKRDEYYLKINSINMGPMEGDNKPSEFSITINFTNKGKDISKWQLGFYLAGAPCLKIVQGNLIFNPRLIRQICDNTNNHCVSLSYDTAKDIIDPDLSQGYTNIFSPIDNFSLIKDKTYTIKLFHINQWGGCNVSYFPQNFFFIPLSKTSKEGPVVPIFTIFKDYNIVNYNHEKTQLDIQDHINKNWGESLDSNNEILSIVPMPVELKISEGKYFILRNNIFIKNEFKDNNLILEKNINSFIKDLNISAELVKGKRHSPDILIQKLTDTETIKNNPEGYTLDIGENKIIIKALTRTGIFYALQTFRQLWLSEINRKKRTLPQLRIVDYPRFKYRGILLDTARHFFTLNEIKNLIKVMAAHKLNTLHLHLSDDEAFRIGLPFYPSIESVGNIRKLGLSMGPMMFPQGNLYMTYKDKFFVTPNDDYSGTYNVNDILEIVSYANLNHITVIPEIDFPAHSRALIKSLPDILVDSNDLSKFVSCQGYTDDVLPVCTYNTNVSIGPKFTKAINKITKYISDIFGNQNTLYAIKNEISIGGDEVSPTAWTNCSSCRGPWKNLNALQKSQRFFAEMSKSLPHLKFSGWQQFIQTDRIELGNEIVPAKKTGHVWVWNSSKPGILQAVELIRNGYPTVLTFSDKTYFDLVYTPDINELGFAWATKWSDTHTALSTVLPGNLIQEMTNHSEMLLGFEGALWSEHLANYDQLIYLALPKMAGLSEASWSTKEFTSQGEKINWISLAKRLGCGNQGFLNYINKFHEAQYRGFPHGIHLEVPKYVCQ